MSGRLFRQSAILSPQGRSRSSRFWHALLVSLLLHLAVILIADVMLRNSYSLAVKRPGRTKLVATVLAEKPSNKEKGDAFDPVVRYGVEGVRLPRPEIVDVVPSQEERRPQPATESSSLEVQQGLGEGDVEDGGQPADADFYRSAELRVRPRPLAEVDIDTSSADGGAEAGTIVLNLWISRFGEVVSVSVVSSDYSESFTRAIIDGFKRLRFSPGMIDDRPVNSLMTVEAAYDDVSE